MESKPTITTTNGIRHHHDHHNDPISEKYDIDLSPTEPADTKQQHDVDPETLREIDHVAEKKLVRRLDLFIVPPVMLLYLFVRTQSSSLGKSCRSFVHICVSSLRLVGGFLRGDEKKLPLWGLLSWWWYWLAYE